jgi:hypothetical protein
MEKWRKKIALTFLLQDRPQIRDTFGVIFVSAMREVQSHHIHASIE